MLGGQRIRGVLRIPPPRVPACGTGGPGVLCSCSVLGDPGGPLLLLGSGWSRGFLCSCSVLGGPGGSPAGFWVVPGFPLLSLSPGSSRGSSAPARFWVIPGVPVLLLGSGWSRGFSCWVLGGLGGSSAPARFWVVLKVLLLGSGWSWGFSCWVLGGLGGSSAPARFWVVLKVLLLGSGWSWGFLCSGSAPAAPGGPLAPAGVAAGRQPRPTGGAGGEPRSVPHPGRGAHSHNAHHEGPRQPLCSTPGPSSEAPRDRTPIEPLGQARAPPVSFPQGWAPLNTPRPGGTALQGTFCVPQPGSPACASLLRGAPCSRTAHVPPGTPGPPSGSRTHLRRYRSRKAGWPRPLLRPVR
ncbi:uncharacterized PE-PGRS family protein PE_PGRS10-like [Poecile atricapillus]|uniref:uncharacterized PE-PGRS family protein PE_PGRS10-like n=1 Tax=Poecile atricapillus TaxID=48891 RepID=UPI0027388507|nr:uncharacterized PE-PGRS family protein PE_PGRS10-like [Poecile atricapillus]